MLGNIHVRSAPAKFIGEVRYEDPDFDLRSKFIRFCRKELSIDDDVLVATTSRMGGSLLPWSARRLYCSECLSRDIADGLLPAWRKSWCYVTSAYCSVHHIELSYFLGHEGLNKGWAAFAVEANRIKEPPSSKVFRIWQSDPVHSTKNEILKKVSLWLDESFSQSDNLALRQRLECFEFVLRMFLQSPTTQHVGGVAWHITHWGRGGSRLGRYRYSFIHSLRMGVIEAKINERVCAFVLAAKVFSIVSDEDVGVMAEAMRDFYYYFSLSRFELGRRSATFGCRQDYAYVIRKLKSYPLARSPGFMDFLMGIQSEEVR